MKILIIEIQENLIKTCLAKKSLSKTHIESLKAFALDNPINAPKLKEIADSFGKIDHLIISLARRQFMVKFLKLPSQNRLELCGMLEFQLAKAVPYSLDDVLYDFTFINAEEGYSNLSVYLIQKKKLDAVFDFIKTLNPLNFSLTISSLGVEGWFLNQNQPEDSLIVDVDANSADFCAIVNKNLFFSRSFGFSNGQELNQGIESSKDILKKELPSLTVNNTVFIGLDSELKPINRLIFSKKGEEVLKQRQYSWISLIGLALLGKNLSFKICDNLLKPARKKALLKKQLINSAVIIFELAIIASIVFAKFYYNHLLYLKFLRTELRQNKSEQKGAMSSQRLSLLKGEGRSFLSLRLVEIINLIPNGTRLELIEFSQQRDFTLRGYTLQADAAFKLAASLKKLKGFKSVKVDYVSRIERAGEERVEFKISGKQY